MSYSSLKEKRCPDCGETKPVEAFSKNASRPDGLQFYCKSCYSARYTRAYRERRLRLGLPVRAQVDVPSGHKYCPGCHHVSPLSNWHRNASSRDGYGAYCKDCRRKQAEADHLRRTFGLTIEERDALFASQGGVCAICRERPIKHLDHDHPTGQVRGGLCGLCNMGLGQFEDDPTRLVAAAAYVRAHRRNAFLTAIAHGNARGQSKVEARLRECLAS